VLEADLLIGNLEAPLTARTERVCSWRNSLRAEPGYVDVMKSVGFDAVCLANNHAMDYGWEALHESIMHLEQAGILHFGAGVNAQASRKPAIVDVHGKKIALLGYCDVYVGIPLYAGENTPGVAALDLRSVAEDVAAARRVADHVIVNVHWGTEYIRIPHPAQREIAAAIVRAGASLVIGHHPHVLQGAERFGEQAAFYSLGNFVFADGSWTGVNPAGEPFTDIFKLPESCRATGIAHAWLDAKGVERISMAPVRLREDRTLHPDPARGEMDEKRLCKTLSSPLYRVQWAMELLRVRSRAMVNQILAGRSPWQALKKVRPRHIKGVFQVVKNEARQFKGAKQA
jgi:poly-gamma-glutamate capsule biosynthesis protein CapA/YwtB (metallophosphatase superfamily)